MCTKNILDKIVKNGISTSYFWKKDAESFKNIVNILSENGEIIRDILKQKFNYKHIFKNHTGPYKTKLMKRIKDKSVSFDATEFWYSTEYAESFINSVTLEYFLGKAYKRCLMDDDFTEYFESRGMQPTREIFDSIFLEGHDDQTLLTLMRYSPSLIQYIINLDDTYKQRTSNMQTRKDLIFQMVLHDHLTGNFMPHGDGFLLVPSVVKKFDKNGKFERVDIKVSMSCYAKGKSSFNVKQKTTTTGDVHI